MLIRTAAFAAAVFITQSLCGQQPCEKLAELKLPHSTITSALSTPAGQVAATFGGAPIQTPARCVVKGIARPTSDSEIKFEVWLPTAGWNGRYQQLGNGGWAGGIPTQPLAVSVQRGYAAAGTDDGHESTGAAGASWAIGHPEKLIDFGYRALHETNQQAKAIISAFYGKDAARSYFFGCSDGGREALMEAQRYPEDFDGIIAGAPAYDWSHHFTGFIWNEQALLKDAASAIPPTKLPMIQAAALAVCDGNDGVKDGLVEDPRTCRFDPSVLTCKGADAPECLTAPQVAALKKIYEGPKNPRTGKQIYPGYPPSVEGVPGAWSPWIITNPPDKAIQFAFGNSYYGHAVFETQSWDFRELNFDSDVQYGDDKAGHIINANNPDLRSFRAHGGKLIQYHGWADAAIAPVSSIDYYEKVTAFLNRYPDARVASRRPVNEFYRLFMVPGMSHCAGGIGPNKFGNGLPAGDAEHDVVVALEQWVEKGVAPDKIIGTGTVVGQTSKTLTRPLCPYPQVAQYNGTGDPNSAASFTCAAPKQP